MDKREYVRIPPEKFRRAREGAVVRDEPPTVPPRGYWADALWRFRKNRSSVVAAWILLFLVVFALLAPVVSGRTLDETDDTYVNHPPFIRTIADRGWGIFDGAVTHESQSETQLLQWRAIGMETGYDPVIRIVDTETHIELYRGEVREITYYKLKNNKYYERGMVYRTISYEEFERIQAFQDESGLQVIYPYVEPADIEGIRDNPNIWYAVSDSRGAPLLDASGTLIPAYSQNTDRAGPVPYTSLRIEGDTGDYIYSLEKSGALHVRLCYYNYYQYVNGREPSFLFGTNTYGQCLFTAVGVGARFSLIFALAVSVINLTLGAAWGAVQGYYGGGVDMVMDRIADILAGVPFIVVATLFQLHLAQKAGVVPSLLFAFVLTGWISTAALTRKQFYRFKSREFVLAARTLGASDRRLMLRHIFPNALGSIITGSVLVIPGVIGAETTMTYLGIVNIREAFGTSIGVLLSEGQTVATSAPHAMLFPSAFLSLLLISFNLMGNGLRDAFNPSMRGVED